MHPAKPERRWCNLTPDRFVFGLLLAVCALWLSERFQWFGFNQHKGWTVLIAVAAVGAAMLLTLLWWLASLIFRWRFQFGIRSLLLFVLVSSPAFGWLGIEMKQARRQAEALVAIRNLGWEAESDWNTDRYGQSLPGPKPPGPEWLRKILGVDFFSAVYEVVVDRASVTDANLEHLTGLTQLTVLSLDGTKVSDAGLKHFNRSTHLLNLDLSNTAVTDAGIEELRGLKELQELDLSNTRITDAGLGLLAGFPQLSRLSLEGCKITDAGLKRLRTLTQLDSLNLNSTQITDSGLEQLKALRHLRTLALAGTSITDRGLERLKGLKNLEELVLDGTKITDAGLRSIKQASPNCDFY